LAPTHSTLSFSEMGKMNIIGNTDQHSYSKRIESDNKKEKIRHLQDANSKVRKQNLQKICSILFSHFLQTTT
jgi:hypothetical protein